MRAGQESQEMRKMKENDLKVMDSLILELLANLKLHSTKVLVQIFMHFQFLDSNKD